MNDAHATQDAPGRRPPGPDGTDRGGAQPPRRPPGGANLPVLRGHNTALVLGLLRAAGEAGASRLELAEHTGLTPQAVSKILARLRADDLVAESGRRASTGGKPRTVLRMEPAARHAVGVHLDRDEVTLVLADLAGAPCAVRSAPLDFGAGAEPLLATVAREVTALLAGAPGASVLGVGVACPGPLDHTGGILGPVTGAPHWEGFPLRAELAARLERTVVVDKDTNAAALGLARAPAVRRPGSAFAYLHLGTGLGAGLVLDGALHRGERTAAGEFGHQVLQLDGPPCACGRRGCVEALCLAAVARRDVPEAARVLGVAARNLVELLDIDEVVLGGRTVLRHGEAFVDGVDRELRAPARGRASEGRAPRVVLPGAGGRVVADGAAELVLGRLFAGPTAPFAAGG